MAESSTTAGFRSRSQQTEGKWLNFPTEVTEICSGGETNPVIYGKFYIPGQVEAGVSGRDFQAASAAAGQEKVRGQRLSGSEEIWLRLQPVVECGDSSMTLTVRRRRAVQLLLDRVNESSVALSQLPPQCGYSVQTTWRDLSLLVQYDACHVTLQSGSYVLPLLWRETPLRMSCPASPTQLSNPPTLCCSTHGLTVRVFEPAASETLRVNVRGEWSPLVALADQCGFTLDRQDAQLVIAAPFNACGIRVKDGKYTLSLRTGEKTFTLSCPLSPTEDLPATRPPLTRRSEPFPWAPPFYLAPPDYPHPAYHHQNPGPQRPDSNNPPTSTPSTFDPTSAPVPPVDPQQDSYSHHTDSFRHVVVSSSPSSAAALEDSGPVHPHLQETSVSGLDTSHSSFPPPLQPRGHAYYHYYHHPKIPLPDPPEDPGPDFLPLSNPHKSGSSVSPSGFPRSEDQSRFSSDQLRPSEGADVPPQTRSPAQSFSYLHSSSPHIVRGEAKRSAPVKTDLSDDQVTLQPDSDQTIPSNVPSWIKPTLLSDEAKLDPPGPDAPEQPLVPPPSPDDDPFLYPYHPHPFFHHSQQRYDSANPGFPAHNEPRTTAPPSESADDGHHHDFQQPHYYYHHLHRQPEVTLSNQEVNPGTESFPVHSAEAGYPSMPQSSPYYNFYFADASQQHLYDPFVRPVGEEAEDLMDDKVKGGVDTDPDTPSASPCGFGLVSDFDCVMDSGCCSCPEEGCSMHLIFPVPELPAASSTDPSEVFGRTTFHQSEVDGIESAPQEFPVRSAVDCSPSSGSPGGLRMCCVMDPPPPPSAAVQLRITTDESFTVFHPDAHLPLSAIKARPVYVEVRLLEPAEPELVLLVHSCLAHTQAPYISWMLVYDSCPSQGDTQLLPSPHPAHIQRIQISSFLPSNHPTHGGYSQLEDPEIFFLCLAEVCSAADGGCTVDCINRPSYEE